MKAIVLVVRGTLSIKDAMTDLSVSMEEAEDKYIDDEHVVKGKKKFVHIVSHNSTLSCLTATLFIFIFVCLFVCLFVLGNVHNCKKDL